MVREGIVEHIRYSHPETGYSVFDVDTPDGGLETFVGYVFGLGEGMAVSAEGDYTRHPVYDLQFQFTSIRIAMPAETDDIERFLASGIIKGIGPGTARKIVQTFGTDTLDIFENSPGRLAEIKGISMNKAIKMALSYSENVASRDAIMFLSQYGISLSTSMKIYAEYGDKLYDIIRQNPYKLAEDIAGLGFKKADEIAVRAGVASNSDIRVRAAVLYVLDRITVEGHMYFPRELLLREVAALIETDAEDEEYRDLFDNLLSELSIGKKIKMRLLEDENDYAVYSSYNDYVETDSADILSRLMYMESIPESEAEESLRTVEGSIGIEFDSVQRLAVKNAISCGVSIITGGPGTGKTTVINAIIKYFELSGLDVRLAAPTGRAAKRITESTGYKAETIHRLLEFSGSAEDDDVKRAAKFIRCRDYPLECDAVIIDEASMLDAPLFHSLLKAMCEGMRLILVGDADQLPSVGAGNVLKDIIDSGCFNVTELKLIYRQAAESEIITNAHKIREGSHIEITNKSRDFFFVPRRTPEEISDEVLNLVASALPDYYNIPRDDIQVLAPMKKRELGVEMLNGRLQRKLNPHRSGVNEKEINKVVYREGDRVMQTRNNYNIEWSIYADKDGHVLQDSGVGVFNGDMGKIIRIDDYNEEVTIRFDDGRQVIYDYSDMGELTHSFAITIHKSQGSEYGAVVIPLYGGPPRFLSRNLLYTAVTRARQIVVIVGNVGLVNRMIDNTEEQRRYTGFAKRLTEAVSST